MQSGYFFNSKVSHQIFQLQFFSLLLFLRILLSLLLSSRDVMKNIEAQTPLKRPFEIVASNLIVDVAHPTTTEGVNVTLLPLESFQGNATSFNFDTGVSSSQDLEVTSGDKPHQSIPIVHSPTMKDNVESSEMPPTSIPPDDLDLIIFFNDKNAQDYIVEVLEN
ncbi:uncharacterized protein LOC109792833 [Cajanus cajan]|uniref:uncharacterized protein LOC109792833 n=1 Tax=Cajanus cajan TaxID=3821 RepID=UPI0010FB000C|nr:uncharacterized protein LOC109792833 [Cajanus cajan]